MASHITGRPNGACQRTELSSSHTGDKEHNYSMAHSSDGGTRRMTTAEASCMGQHRAKAVPRSQRVRNDLGQALSHAHIGDDPCCGPRNGEPACL